MLLDRRAVLLMGLALPACVHEEGPVASTASGLRAASSGAEPPADPLILDVVARVARRNMRPIQDGDYPPPSSPSAARAARPPRGIAWTYPWGVTLYGMLRSADVTGDAAVTRFVVDHQRVVGRYYRWLESLAQAFGEDREVQEIWNHSALKGLLRLGSLDNCGAMGASMLEAMASHPELVTPEGRAVVERTADWIERRQDRLPDGTLWRPRAREGATVWIDDLYMSCAFLVRWARFTGDARHLDDAARQILNVARRAQDADGVFVHGYFEGEQRRSPVKWGRGNGWALLANVEVLSAMPADHPSRARLLDILRRHIAGLERLQARSGMWHQVLDRDDVWEETSCAAAFAYGIARAVNRGFVEPAHLEVARRAFHALSSSVTPDGSVSGVCQGTDIGPDADYYAARKQPENDAHGPGLVLLAGAELLPARARS